MRKIGILSNAQSPGTDVYRTIHPFTKLGYSIKVIDPGNAKWHELHECNVLLASRPNGMVIHNLLSEFKRMRKGNKVVVDMDDNLHELEPSNPAYNHFNQPAVKESVIACLNLADHIIYSTEYLQKYYLTYHLNVPSTVVHNAVDFDITPMLEPQPVHRPVRVLWRGSKHHQEDLLTIKPFWDWILSNKDYEVLFMGMPSDEVYTYYNGAKCVTWNHSPFAFWEKMASLRADVGIFPLKKCKFNFAKSNIFALEMLCNGVLPIVPSGFEEFEHDGVAVYSEDPRLRIESIHSDRNAFLKQGQAWLREHRSIDVVNVARAEIIEGL